MAVYVSSTKSHNEQVHDSQLAFYLLYQAAAAILVITGITIMIIVYSLHRAPVPFGVWYRHKNILAAVAMTIVNWWAIVCLHMLSEIYP